MSLFEDTNPRDLKELLHQIHARDTVLPDFQRDFVWDPGHLAAVALALNMRRGKR